MPRKSVCCPCARCAIRSRSGPAWPSRSRRSSSARAARRGPVVSTPTSPPRASRPCSTSRRRTTLSESQKARVAARLGPRVTAAAQDTRSQARNRELALDRLAARLAHALEVQRPRTATRPTAASRQRRLEGKRRRERREARAPPPHGCRRAAYARRPRAPRYEGGTRPSPVERVAYRHARPPRPRPARARRPPRGPRPGAARLRHEQPTTAAPVVHTARDDGKARAPHRHRARPTVSPDSRWIAYITVPRSSADREEVVLVPGPRRRAPARSLRSRSVTDLRFSPDSRSARRHPARAPRARLRHRRGHHDRHRARAHPRLLLLPRRARSSPSAWPPARRRGVERHLRRAASTARWSAVGSPPRATRSTRSGGRRRSSSTGSAAAAASRRPTTSGRRTRGRRQAPRRLTSLTIPPLFSGLVPLELSSDGRRLLAVFTGQDAGVGFTVDARYGPHARALARRRGRPRRLRPLGGRPRDPRPHRRAGPGAGRTTSCAAYGGGEPTVLVEDAAFPDWSR